MAVDSYYLSPRPYTGDTVPFKRLTGALAEADWTDSSTEESYLLSKTPYESGWSEVTTTHDAGWSPFYLRRIGLFQWVSEPFSGIALSGRTLVFTGDAFLRLKLSTPVPAPDNNYWQCHCYARVVKPDGTLRAGLLAREINSGGYLDTSLTTETVDFSKAATVYSDDRLVVEIGIVNVNFTYPGSGRSITVEIGDGSGTLQVDQETTQNDAHFDLTRWENAYIGEEPVVSTPQINSAKYVKPYRPTHRPIRLAAPVEIDAPFFNTDSFNE